jgi:SH3 domain-containing protein
VPTNYVECPDCGKRALSVATRCPHCGFQFPPRRIVRPSPSPSFGASRGLAAVGAAVLSLIIVALMVRHGRARPERTIADPVPPVTDSMPVPTARAAARAPTPKGTRAAPPARSSAAVPPPPADGSQRYAQTWVNVRGERTRSAPTVGMLNPGDAVTVDSLVRGWYRVLVDGRTLGYVHRSTLDVSRPE